MQKALLIIFQSAPMNTPSYSDSEKHLPQNLVENRTSHAGSDAVFSVYDTYMEAKMVKLKSDSPMYCSMISGKKVIHSGNEKAFDFVPSESLVLPPDTTIFIDFPEAKLNKPTKCITVELPLSRIDDIVSRMNERMPRNQTSGEWKYDETTSVHFSNTESVDLLIKKLYHIFTSDHSQKDLLVDMNTSELIVHMLQTESRNLLLRNYRKHIAKNGLAAAVDYINNNLGTPISIKKLSDIACMSKASFYRYFNNEFGLSPVEYINQARVKKACKLLNNANLSVTDVCYEIGYISPSHFIKLFRDYTGTTPKQYQMQVMRA